MAGTMEPHPDILIGKNLSSGILDQLPGIFFLLDPLGSLLNWNKEFEHIAGYRKKEIFKLNLLDFFAETDREQVLQALRQVKGNGTSAFEAKFISKDRKETHFSISIKCVMLEGRNFILGSGIDISERKRTEESLASEYSNLQRVFDAVNVGMLLIDKDGVRMVNDVASRLARKELSSLEAVQPGDFLGCIHAINDPRGCGNSPHCSLCLVRRTFESVAKTKLPIHGVETEVKLQSHGSENSIWFEVSADPLNIDGRQQVVLAMNNITSRKKAEQALRKSQAELKTALEELKKVNELKSSILRDVSHELKHPISTIVMAIDALKHELQNEEHGRKNAVKYVDIIERNITSFNEQMQSVIELSRLETLRNITKQKGNINNIAKSIVETLQPQAIQKGIALRMDLGMIPEIELNPEMIASLFRNLLTNAIKYTSEGYIELSTRTSGKELVISVKDTGIGLGKENMKKIFSPFFRVDESIEGLGVGLPICKRIAELHNGKIEVYSELGRGSEFSVIFSLSV